jgi:hypothetical protein
VKHEQEAAATAKREAEEAALKVKHPAPPVPDAQLASASLAASASGEVTVRVSCPVGESTCRGTVTLRTLNAVSVAAHVSRHKQILTLASASFTVAGGAVKTVTLHLSTQARRLLERAHVMRARATILAHDPAGASHVTQRIVTLRAPKPKRR